MMLFVFKYKDRIGLFIYGMRKKVLNPSLETGLRD
jgi:hypothetical protein